MSFTSTDYVIGFGVVLVRSFVNALGLNIVRRDQMRNLAKPEGLRRRDCRRVWWHVGIYLYIVSQLVGNAAALSMPQHLPCPV